MKVNKTLLAYVVFICFLLLLPALGRCEDICFDEKVASDVVVELEQGRLIKQETELLKAENAELQRQVDLLKQIVELKDKQLESTNRALKQYSDLLETQGKLYGDALKRSKPSFFEKLSDTLSSVGIGIVIGVLLL
jgi:hypothetical protein